MEVHALVGGEQETNMAHDEHELGRNPAETPAAPLPREDRLLITAMAAVTVTPAAVEILSSRTAPEILAGLPLLAAAAALYGRCVTRRPRHGTPAAIALTVLALLAYVPVPVFGPWWLSVSALPAALALTVLPAPISGGVFALAGLAAIPAAWASGAGSDPPMHAVAVPPMYAVAVLVSGLLLSVLARYVETARTLRRTCPETVAAEVARSRARTDRRLADLLRARLAEIEARGTRVRLLLDENDPAATAELAETAALAKDTQRVLREFAHREFWAEPAGPDDDERHR
jgi:hypothetical protein